MHAYLWMNERLQIVLGQPSSISMYLIIVMLFYIAGYMPKKRPLSDSIFLMNGLFNTEARRADSQMQIHQLLITKRNTSVAMGDRSM